MTNLDGLSFFGQGLESSVALVFAMAWQERQNKGRDVTKTQEGSEHERQKGSEPKRHAGRRKG